MNMVLIFVITPYKVSNHQEFSSSIVKIQNDNKMRKVWNAEIYEMLQELTNDGVLKPVFCLQAWKQLFKRIFLRISKIKTNESKAKVK